MATKAKAAKNPRAKQEVIPGTDHDRHKDLDALADRWHEAKEGFMELSEQVTSMKAEGLALLKKYKIESYVAIGGDGARYEITIKAGEETAQVKRAKPVKAEAVVE